jgi:hypothetical protein
MKERAQFAAEAQELVVEYRHLAGLRPTPEDLEVVGFALGRALAALERPGDRELPRVAAEIAAARKALARVRGAHCR